MKQTNRLLFVTPIMSSFIDIDRRILQEKFDLELNYYDWKSKWKTPLLLIKQFFYLILNIRKYNLIVVSFGGYWSLVPSLLGWLFKVPCYIILHGTDCAAIPSKNYGNLRGRLLKTITGISYKFAAHLIPVSNSLIKVFNTYDNIPAEYSQGFKVFFPNMNTKTSVVYNGIDTKLWVNKNKIIRKQNFFLAVFGQGQFQLKGGDLIINLAKLFPEKEFRIVGFDCNISKIPHNVNFLGRISQERLRDIYYESKYYFQLSVYEGFGCALCEAMLCGCIPIVSNVNMLPEIVNDYGFVVPKRDINKIKEVIDQLDSFQVDIDQMIRSIEGRFNLENRKRDLLGILNEKKLI